jgi:hypothetical protein
MPTALDRGYHDFQRAIITARSYKVRGPIMWRDGIPFLVGYAPQAPVAENDDFS